ncbi:MAG: DUF2752 domain-containing protein [Planctomycetes bacterium]|nr:DUF2752 domain-containing protein [Planctomycetota bacterium]
MPKPRAPWTVPIAQGPLRPAADRAFAVAVAVVAAVCGAALARVQPDARGHGTHEQLGLDPCGWPIHYGIPCPTCGCTTAACLVVHGRPFSALATQPFGAVVALFGLAVGVHALVCLVRGRSFADLLLRIPFWRLVLGFVVLFFVGWGTTWLTWEGR